MMESEPKPITDNETQSPSLEDVKTWESKDLYERLGLLATSSPDEIKRAFRQLSMKYHPDMVPVNATLQANYSEIQKLITEAYLNLSNQEKREKYDRQKKTAEKKSVSEQFNQNERIKNFAAGIQKALSDFGLFNHEEHIAQIRSLIYGYSRDGIPKDQLLLAIEPIVTPWLLKVSGRHSPYFLHTAQRTIKIVNDYVALGLNKEHLFSATENIILDGLYNFVTSEIIREHYAFTDIKKVMEECEKFGIDKKKVVEKTEPIFLNHFSGLVRSEIAENGRDDIDLHQTMKNYISVGVSENKLIEILRLEGN